MTIIEKRLVDNYTILVMAERVKLEEVPDTKIELDGLSSTIRNEVEIKKSKREIEILTKS